MSEILDLENPEPIKKEITEIGIVSFHPYLTMRMLRSILKEKEKASNTDKVSVFVNATLSNLIQSPSFSPEEISDLNEESYKEILEVAIDLLKIRDEYESQPDDKNDSKKFHDAFMEKENKYREQISKSIESIYKSIKPTFTQLSSLANVQKDINDSLIYNFRNIFNNKLVELEDTSYLFKNGEISVSDERSVEEDVEIVSSDEAFDHIELTTESYEHHIEENIIKARSDSSRFFKLTLIAVSAGFLLITIGIILLFSQTTNKGIITTASGILIEIVGSLFFTKDKDLRSDIEMYHRYLQQTKRISTMTELAETIHDPKAKDEVKKLIISKTLGME